MNEFQFENQPLCYSFHLFDATRQIAAAGIPSHGREEGDKTFHEYPHLTCPVSPKRSRQKPQFSIDGNRGVASNRSSNLGRSRWTELVRCPRPEEVPRIALTRVRRDKAIPRQWNYADCRLESISIGSAERTWVHPRRCTMHTVANGGCYEYTSFSLRSFIRLSVRLSAL